MQSMEHFDGKVLFASHEHFPLKETVNVDLRDVTRLAWRGKVTTLRWITRS